MRKSVICMKIDKDKPIECLVRATIECHIFPETECFFCGLCDRVRKERKYYDNKDY